MEFVPKTLRSQSLSLPTQNLSLPLFGNIPTKQTSLVSLSPSLHQTSNPQLFITHQNSDEEFEIPPELLFEEPEDDLNKILEDLCQICLYNDKEFSFSDCQHSYCYDCLRTYIDVKIKTSVLSVNCPKCQIKINDADVRSIVTPDTFSQFEKFQELARLRMNKNCRWCPRADCGTPVIGLSSTQKLTCPTCTTHFCFHCGLKWHGKKSCQKNKEELIKQGRLNKHDEEWKKKHSRPCPKCGAHIEKGGGCNHMNCWSCLHQFCWLCMGTYEEGHYAEGGPCAFLCYTFDPPDVPDGGPIIKKKNTRKKTGRYVVGGVVAVVMLPVAIIAVPFYAGYRYRLSRRNRNKEKC